MALMKGRIKVWELPVNWLIVFFGNLAGALCLDAFMGERVVAAIRFVLYAES
jgi:formate/nitrite transporter FocA (FNT family)